MAPQALLELYKAKVRPTSQRSLAKRLGVSHTAIQKYEQGGGMSARVILHIGRELRLSESEMICAIKRAGV